MAITISGENNNDRILAQDGVIDQISGINIVGLLTAGHINVGSNIQLGNAGIVTATTFIGNLTGNVNSTSPLLLQTGGSERFRITGNNELGIAGANYGSSGQVLTSGGSGSAVTWSAIPSQATIANNADNRVITGGSGVNLNGEANLSFNGTNVKIGSGTPAIAVGSGLEIDSGGAATVRLEDSGVGSSFEIQNTGGVIKQKLYNNQPWTIENGGGERLRIKSNGYVGIGTDNPFREVDIISATNSQDVRIWSQGLSSNSRLFLRTGNSGGAFICFGDTADEDIGKILYSNTTDSLQFTTNAAERLRIDNSGYVMIGNTAATAQYSKDLVVGTTSGEHGITIISQSNSIGRLLFSDSLSSGAATYQGQVNYNHSNDELVVATYTLGQIVMKTSNAERLRIASDGNFGFNTNSPSAYALATFNSANGIQLQGDSQSRILMRNNTGGTNEKMMDIQCNGNINFRTINDDYTTATTRATFRTDGNFVVGNRVGTSSPSTNQPVAFHSARITPDGMTSTVSNGVRCNLYVGSNGGWAAGDGGVIGMGGSRSGSAGQEAIWSYIKGSRQSGNGWEYAGKMELGTTEWGTYNMTKAVTIYADNQFSLHGDDNTMMTFNIGGALRLLIEHTGGGNMRLRNASSGSVTYSTSSDYRLKENTTTISNALSTVKALKPYQYTWKHDGKLGQGFFAHEAQEVLPDVGIVSGTKDEVQTEDDTKHDEQWKKDDPIYQSIDYSKLVPLLTAALQEETAKREALEARVAALEGS